MRSFADDLLSRMGPGDVNGVPLFNGDEVLIICGADRSCHGTVLGAESKGRLRGYNITLTTREGGRPICVVPTCPQEHRLPIRWFWHANIEMPVTQALARVEFMEELIRAPSPRALRRRILAARPQWKSYLPEGSRTDPGTSAVARILRMGDQHARRSRSRRAGDRGSSGDSLAGHV